MRKTYDGRPLVPVNPFVVPPLRDQPVWLVTDPDGRSERVRAPNAKDALRYSTLNLVGELPHERVLAIGYRVERS